MSFSYFSNYKKKNLIFNHFLAIKSWMCSSNNEVKWNFETLKAIFSKQRNATYQLLPERASIHPPVGKTNQPIWLAFLTWRPEDLCFRAWTAIFFKHEKQLPKSLDKYFFILTTSDHKMLCSFRHCFLLLRATTTTTTITTTVTTITATKTTTTTKAVH